MDDNPQREKPIKPKRESRAAASLRGCSAFPGCLAGPPVPALHAAARALVPTWRALTRVCRGSLDLLAPGLCRGCGVGLDGGAPLCAGCQRDIRWITSCCRRCGAPLPTVLSRERPSPPRPHCSRCEGTPLEYDCARAAGEYAGALRALILQYKFHEDRGALGFLVAALAWAYSRENMFRRGGTSSRRVTSVPQHFTRRLRRGRDPARELAAAFARSLGWEFAPLLAKTRRTPSQVSRSRITRRRNVRDSFRLRRRRELPGSILLVDDVFTTGTTVAECARVLKAAGVREVAVLTVARSWQPPSGFPAA